MKRGAGREQKCLRLTQNALLLSHLLDMVTKHSILLRTHTPGRPLSTLFSLFFSETLDYQALFDSFLSLSGFPFHSHPALISCDLISLELLLLPRTPTIPHIRLALPFHHNRVPLPFLVL